MRHEVRLENVLEIYPRKNISKSIFLVRIGAAMMCEAKYKICKYIQLGKHILIVYKIVYLILYDFVKVYKYFIVFTYFLNCKGNHKYELYIQVIIYR